MKTITFDEVIYRLVPVESVTASAMEVAFHYAAGMMLSRDGYAAMIAAVPADLPGVVEHNGEPVGLFRLDPSWGAYMQLRDGYACTCDENPVPLFTHPPAQPTPMHEQNARFAINGAIAFDMQGVNKPPESDHWLMEYWEIRRKLAAQAGQEPIFWYNAESDVERHRMYEDVDQVVITGATAKWGRSTAPLYAAPPAPANPLAIVQAALDAAEKSVIDASMNLDGDVFVSDFTEAIRAINPQTIIDAATKGQS